MKNLSIALFLMLATVAMADTAKPEPKASTTTAPAAHIDAGITTTTTTKSAKIKRNGLTYSGAATTAVKAKNPLQLINPFAPMSYGSGEENVNRDPDSGIARGINLLAVGR